MKREKGWKKGNKNRFEEHFLFQMIVISRFWTKIFEFFIGMLST